MSCHRQCGEHEESDEPTDYREVEAVLQSYTAAVCKWFAVSSVNDSTTPASAGLPNTLKIKSEPFNSTIINSVVL